MKAPKVKKRKGYAAGGVVDFTGWTPAEIQQYNDADDSTKANILARVNLRLQSDIKQAADIANIDQNNSAVLPIVGSALNTTGSLLTQKKAPGITSGQAAAGLGFLSGTIDQIDQADGRTNTGASTASGALGGAAAGSALGPVGAAVGAVIGGTVGFLKGSSANAKRKAALDKVIGDSTGAFNKSVLDTKIAGAKTSMYDDDYIDTSAGDIAIARRKFNKEINKFKSDNDYAEGGKVKGAGTAKSDSINANLPKGSFVVPSENSAIAAMLRNQFLGDGGLAKLKGKGTKVKVSDGEHVFTPEEVQILTAKGIDLNKLAPNADTPLQTGAKLADGTIDFDKYRKDPFVKGYLLFLERLEADKKEPLTGGTKIDKNKDGVPDSTAKGKFQFIKKTRKEILDEYGVDAWKNDSAEQERAAIALLHKQGVLNDIEAGHYSKADAKLNKIWPSLPGGSQRSSALKPALEQRQGTINLLRTQGTNANEAGLNPNLNLKNLPKSGFSGFGGGRVRMNTGAVGDYATTEERKKITQKKHPVEEFIKDKEALDVLRDSTAKGQSLFWNAQNNPLNKYDYQFLGGNNKPKGIVQKYDNALYKMERKYGEDWQDLYTNEEIAKVSLSQYDNLPAKKRLEKYQELDKVKGGDLAYKKELLSKTLATEKELGIGAFAKATSDNSPSSMFQTTLSKENVDRYLKGRTYSLDANKTILTPALAAKANNPVIPPIPGSVNNIYTQPSVFTQPGSDYDPNFQDTWANYDDVAPLARIDTSGVRFSPNAKTDNAINPVPDTLTIPPDRQVKTTVPVVSEAPLKKLYDTLGGAGGLIGAGQALIGLSQDNGVQPTFFTPSEVLLRNEDALTQEKKARAEANEGFSGATKTGLLGNLELARRTRNAEIDATTSNSGTGILGKQVNSNAKYNALVNMAAQDEQLKLAKQSRADNLSARPDAFANELAGIKRMQFNDANAVYNADEAAKGNLINAGISNLWDSITTSAIMRLREKNTPKPVTLTYT